MSFKLVAIKDIPKAKLKKFDCGTEVLNEFLSRYSFKNDILGIGKTFVAFNKNEDVIGYFTLAAAQVLFEDIPDNYTKEFIKLADFSLYFIFDNKSFIS